MSNYMTNIAMRNAQNCGPVIFSVIISSLQNWHQNCSASN